MDCKCKFSCLLCSGLEVFESFCGTFEPLSRDPIEHYKVNKTKSEICVSS